MSAAAEGITVMAALMTYTPAVYVARVGSAPIAPSRPIIDWLRYTGSVSARSAAESGRRL